VHLENEAIAIQDREDRREKEGRDEAAGAAAGAAPPMSPPRPDPSHEWKKSKMKTEDLLALLNSGFIREKEMDS
jgi:hypothetical protein